MKTNWKKLLSFLLALCLAVGLCPTLALPAEAAASDGFEIVDNGKTLQKYTGPGGDVTIPDGVTTIGSDAFKGCAALTSVTIPDSVTSIGPSCFQDCTGLKSVTMPEGVKKIGSYCFLNCTSLTSVVMPKQITSLPHGCFQACEKLTGVTLWDGLTTIEAMCFSGCTKLADVVLPEGLTTIKTFGFGDCANLRSIKIPSTVTELGNWAFVRAGLAGVDLPDRLKIMGNGCFLGCPMTELSIPAGVTTLDPLASKQSENKIKKLIFEGTDLSGIRDSSGKLPSIFPDVAVYHQPDTVRPEWVAESQWYDVTEQTPRYRLSVQGSKDGALDLGDIAVINGGEASCTVGITNTGTDPLNLLTVQTSSGAVCRVTDPREKTLAPNASTSFTFYTAAGLKAGSHTAQVTVTTQEGLTVDLTVRFTVVAKGCSLSAQPAALDFGSVDPDYTQPGAKTVTITNTGDEPVTLLEHNLANKYFLLGALSKKTLAAGESITVTFQPKADLTGGSYHETIKYSCLKHSGSDISIDLQFTVKGTPGLSVSAAELDFGHADVSYGQQDSKTVTITNTGSMPITLSTVSLSSSDFEFSSPLSKDLTLQPGKSVQTGVRPKRYLWHGTYTGTLDIKASDGLSASVPLKFVVGSGVDEWHIMGVRFTPSKLRFDPVGEGYKTVAPQTVTFTNNNSYALRQSFALSNSNFEITSRPSSAQLAAKETASISVRPKDGLKQGAYTATLTVTLSLGSSLTDTMDIPLTFVVGEGTGCLISPDPDSLDFGTENVGYKTIDARTVTLTNAGSAAVTLNTPTLSTTDFELVKNPSASPLAAGSKTTLSVRPKDGLAKGTYTADLKLTGSDGLSFSIPVKFVVDGASFLSASPEKLDFGTVAEGYTQPDAQTVTLTNTGKDPLTLQAPTSTSYDLGPLSRTTLAAGQTATFTVRPKAELKNGAYTEQITVKTEQGDSAAVSASFQVGKKGPTFTDVKETDWFYEDVEYAHEKGLVNGVGNNRFNPYGTTTRAQIVTILYRLEGQPPVSGRSTFADVPTGQYYSNAVKWAADNKIVNGYSSAQFAPNDPITREQMAAILYRYAGYKGYGTSARASLSKYVDAGAIGSYATDAMSWANSCKLINGTSGTTLEPKGSATRAQVAAILHRFCENIAQ